MQHKYFSMLLFSLFLFMGLLLEGVAANPPARTYPPARTTYSINRDCYIRDPNFDEVVDEMFLMARRASQRTHATIVTDMDWERVLRFFMIYGTLPVDSNQVPVFPTHQEFQSRWGFNRESDYRPAHRIIIEIMTELGGGWIKLDPDAEERAEVRIYCNDMPRNVWKRARGTVNGHRSVEGYRNDDNLVWTQHKCGSFRNRFHYLPGNVIAVTASIKAAVLSHLEPPLRSVITLCDAAFSSGGSRRFADTPLDEKLDNDPKLVQELNLLSAHLMRAWLQTERFAFKYHPELGHGISHSSSMGFQYARRIQNANDALCDPESYAFLGLFALLADRKPVLEASMFPVIAPKGGYSLRRDIGSLQVDGPEMRNGRVLGAYEDLQNIWQ